MLGLEIAVVETVEQEIHQIRHYSFCTLGFQQLNNMVICQRREFYQDLPYNANLWFLDVFAFQLVKITYDSLDVAAKFHHGRRALG